MHTHRNICNDRQRNKCSNNINSFAKRNGLGRPRWILCTLKSHLTPFRVVQNDENVITVNTKIYTVISAYFNPFFNDIEIFDKLANTLNRIPAKDAQNIILQRDINCRSDIPNNKMETVISFLQEEGIQLTNNKDSTYQ